MSTIEDGSPAFPGERLVYVAGYKSSEREPVAGMTLRDYFAAKAMQSILAALIEGIRPQDCINAADAYSVADAMLRARKERHV